MPAPSFQAILAGPAEMTGPEAGRRPSF